MSHVETYMQAWGFAEQEAILCERCRRQGGECHHIVYRSHGGGDEFENLIWLCRPCHDWAHTRADHQEVLKRLKLWPTKWKGKRCS